jgi:hypothetical protein
MNKRMSHTLALLGGMIAVAASASAQTRQPFLDVSAAGQVTTTSFSQSSTFPSFGETGTTATNQNVGKGFVVDVSGGKLFWGNLGVGAGLWFGHQNGAAASTALFPDPLIAGKFTTVSTSATDLKQTTVGFDIQLIWMTTIKEKYRIALSGGPTILHVSQDIGSIAVIPGTQTATPSTSTESATTGKAGNIGVDLSYWIAKSYGIGGFVRYAGGEADLPSVSNLKVGGLQLGGGLRVYF